MKKIIILLFLTNLFSIVAMEEQPKRKFSEISEKPEKEKEKEKEHIPQCPIPRKRRRIEPKAVTVLPLRELAKQKFIEVAPELENLPELLESIPAEELKEEIKAHFQKPLSYEETRLHNARSELEVERLLALGIDPNSKDRDGRTALNALINNGNLDIAFHLLVLKGKDLDVSSADVYGATPLQRAIKRQDAELATSIIEILSEQNELNSVYDYDSVGQSAFFLAIRYMPEIIGEDIAIMGPINHITTKLIPMAPRSKNKFKVTPLMIAAQYQPKLIPLLLKAGAWIETEDKQGKTPLMYAAEFQQASIQPFIQAGADPNATDNRGHTALTYAISSNKLIAVKQLLDAGAQVTQKDVALANGKFEIQKLLHEYFEKLFLN